MAFKLIELDDEVFQAKNGEKFTVELTTNRGAVQVLSVRYANEHSTSNPAEFTVNDGTHDLILVFQATNNDALVRLHEVDGAKSQLLTVRPAFDATLSIEIQGRADLVARRGTKKASPRRRARKGARKAVKKEVRP